MAAARAISLFDRVEEIEALAQLMEASSDEELSPDHRAAIEQQLLAQLAATREHVDRTAAVLAAFDAAEMAAAKEAERLAQRARHFASQRERLEGYCLSLIQARGMKALEGFTATLKPRNNPPSVHVDPAAELPAEFLRPAKPMPPSPDKAAIKAALQRGEFVPGCRITQTVRLVRQ